MNELKCGIADELPRLLRELYGQHGYSRYRTVGFEEYDLFSEYRDFITGGQMITFTGAGGRLLALKPDITLSILRDASEQSGRTDKFFYSESVYRVPAGGDEFKEILQIGLECIGDVLAYDRAEVVSLACRTLAITGRDYMLDISHTGLTEGIRRMFGIPYESRGELASALKDKSAPALTLICERAGMDKEKATRLIELSRLSIPITEASEVLGSLGFNEYAEARDAINELSVIAEALNAEDAEHVRVDPSVIHGMNYYDGAVFNGYIDGISEAILKGGEYGRLIANMGRGGSGLGFALYTDLLEQIKEYSPKYAADVMLVCEDSDPRAVSEAVKRLAECGKSVLVQRRDTGDERCACVMRLTENGETEVIRWKKGDI